MKFIYGPEKFFINKNINKIKNQFPDESIVIFESNSDLNEIIESISTKSLFDQKKLIILNNIEILNSSKLTKKEESIIKKLIYVLSNEKDNEIVFVNETNKLSSNLLIDFLINNFVNIECKKMEKKDLINQLTILVQEKNVKFSYTNINVFLEKMPNDLQIIMNEFNNLVSNYNEITFEIIEDIISKYAKNDVFSFLASIETYDLKHIYSKYLERVSEGDDPLILIGQLGSIFNDCIAYYYMSKLGMNNVEISKKLKQPDWKVKKISGILRNLSFSKIKKITKELAKIDIQTKTTGVESNELFEMFLIKNF
ncbi:DNA-directed DNA polymerase [Mycoplasmopsis canis PG 14]|uniref:DNA polymerase III subunit delta n=1 Tax=Mycoplasmopsis canis TaxID=29555 RepID=A0A449AQD1_9BACT|nr:DNA polymerase III subunit delta [Mycoplasmopsis canis]AMD81260.1 DNA polymerase III subunit delta [Mycoplasmopsis canis PG 14]EIE40599.1 DNA-directed DNA polymerase [Mycoplasmopsis canis PG 14]VEU68768.1 DNA-directed DNA polymerase [Mycoplasmopsis canis]